MRVDPRAEWEQIYRENWRIQREYFYDPKFHGNDWQAIYERSRAASYVGHALISITSWRWSAAS
jgi:hypothetical protein